MQPRAKIVGIVFGLFTVHFRHRQQLVTM